MKLPGEWQNGVPWKVSRLPEMLPGYYAVRGWDESGVPTDEKLQELGLSRL